MASPAVETLIWRKSRIGWCGLKGGTKLDSNLIPKHLTGLAQFAANGMNELVGPSGIWLPTLDTFRTFAA